MSKSTRGARVAGIAGLAVTLSIGVAAPAFAAAGFEFARIAGDDRYATAVKASEQYGASKDVIIANGQPGEYADALAGNYLAGATDAPILLTKRSGLPEVTKDRLATIKPTNVWIVGGTAAVPADQEAELKAAGYNVVRLAGDDRFGTNAKVIAEDGAATGGVGLIATGLNFPDALAAGPFAYKGHSLGLSRTNSLPDVVGDALEADGVKQVLIFGGTDAVGAGVVSDLAARGITVLQRFAGADRSETSELAAEWAVANLKFSDEHVGVASGYTEGFGADALAGGPVEGNENSPMLITRNVDNPDDVIDYLENHSATLADGHIYGGTAAISAAAEAAMKTAATGTAAGFTSLPELVSAKVVSTTTTGQASDSNPVGTRVAYTFDEAIASAGGLGPDATKFFVYNTAGATDATTGRTAGTSVVSVSGNVVTIRFAGIATTTAASALSVATVDNNAVRDSGGAFNPEGDAALGSTSGGGTVTLPAGVTEAPDLQSVSGFRNFTLSGAPRTAVDFTFDEAAATNGTAGSPASPADLFQLIQLNGSTINGTAPAPASTETGGGTAPGGNGTKVITVIYDGTITAADVARGFVGTGSVSEVTDNESPADGLDSNVGQAADVSNGGNTTEPDLVSVELRPGATATAMDRALFTFDEAINPASVDEAKFYLYNSKAQWMNDPAATSEVNASDARQVLITFSSATATDGMVGGLIDVAAVTSTTAAGADSNELDEVGVANSTTGAAQTAGKTGGPDLTAVALATSKDNFGNVNGTNATYTFDEAVTTTDGAALTTDALFHLYRADGTVVSDGVCVAGPAAGTADNNTVVCNFNGTPVTAPGEDMAATLGTVDFGAVTDGTYSNPEGAERTTGGTGTPAA